MPTIEKKVLSPEQKNRQTGIELIEGKDCITVFTPDGSTYTCAYGSKFELNDFEIDKNFNLIKKAYPHLCE
jgi:hypothetical protein